MTAFVMSHREIDGAAVKLGNLIIEVPGQDLVSPEFVPDWDYSTPVKVRAEVTTELEACYASSGQGHDAEFGLSLVWSASGSGLRGASAIQVLRDGRNSVELVLDGTVLGGILTVQLAVTLVRPSGEPAALAAHRRGSLLWSDERRVRLEGTGSRFPISHVSFSEAGLASGLHAAWLVMFETTELYDSGIGNLRLYLNTDLERVLKFVAEPDEYPQLGEILRADVNRQVVLQALAAEDLDLSHAYPPDSLGQLLATTVNRNFPGRSLEETRALARNSPGEFEAHLQARGGFLA